MSNTVRVIGVHSVPADEPVHLIEIELNGDVESFNFAEVTQELPGEPRENWQVAYDEQEVGRGAAGARFAFFFHYLDWGKPLETPFGAVPLPAESETPGHLQRIEYEPPG